MPIVSRTVRAQAGETIEIVWRLVDGSTYRARHTCPPRATREAREAEQAARTAYTQELQHEHEERPRPV